ncbi:MAG: hypothetical protein EON59_11575, partial [Alphaproteobacteria bacterium]
MLCAIAFNWHDSSVSFSRGNRIVLVLEAERHFRTKKKACSALEMEALIRHGAAVLGITIEDIDHWALASLNNPWLSSRQTRKLADDDYWWDDVAFLGHTRRCLIVSHHYAHAASSFFMSGAHSAVVQTCDGGGDFNECVVAFSGRENELERLPAPCGDAISGLPYNLIAGFFYRERFCEGKMMALAALGSVDQRHAALIDDMLPTLNQAGAEIVRGAGADEISASFARSMERVNRLLNRQLGHMFSAPGVFSPDGLDFIATLQ